MTDPDPLADLAAQLAELRGQLARSQGDIRVLRDRLEDSTGQTVNLLVEVKHLREELAEAIEKRRLKPPPAPWWLVGPEQAQAMLTELREWVETFLRPHYPDYLPRLPQCWASHRTAIWELSTIHAEWIRIYGGEENRDLQGALTWLNRYLPDTLNRLATALGKCDEAGCQLTRPNRY
jgi:regulator of replication initiation timing